MEIIESVVGQQLWGRSLQTWLIVLGIAVATAGGLRIVKSFLRSRLNAVARRTASKLDDILVATIDRTFWFSYLAIGALAGAAWLRPSASERVVINQVATLALLLQLGLWLQTAIRHSATAWAEKHDGGRGGQTFTFAIGLLLRLITWSVLLLVALGNLGVEITPLVASLGIGGIAAALAVQSTLGDLMASFSIYFDRPFDIGDFIIVGEFMGTVESIGLRTTRVASLGGEQLIFPNSDLTSSRIRNYGRMERRRIVFKIGVEYGTTYAQLEAIPGFIRSIVEATDHAQLDRCHFAEYGDFSLVFETVYYVLSPDYTRYMDVQQTINLAIFKKFQQDGIAFAFPTRTLHVASTPAIQLAARGAQAARATAEG